MSSALHATKATLSTGAPCAGVVATPRDAYKTVSGHCGHGYLGHPHNVEIVEIEDIEGESDAKVTVRVVAKQRWRRREAVEADG